MWHWYGECRRLERLDSINREIISEYALQTKVSSGSRAELRRQLESNRSVDKILLSEAEEKYIKERNIKGAWKAVTIIGVPVSIAGGTILGLMIAQKIN
jgi:hypothetical protein